jgi:hypothetical protein
MNILPFKKKKRKKKKPEKPKLIILPAKPV